MKQTARDWPLTQPRSEGVDFSSEHPSNEGASAQDSSCSIAFA